jgi:hypothetical protein
MTIVRENNKKTMTTRLARFHWEESIRKVCDALLFVMGPAFIAVFATIGATVVIFVYWLAAIFIVHVAKLVQLMIDFL